MNSTFLRRLASALLVSAVSFGSLNSAFALAEDHASDEIKISIRQTGPSAPQPIRKSTIEVVSLRGDPNFVDRAFQETEKKDNKLFARNMVREPAAVQGTKRTRTVKTAQRTSTTKKTKRTPSRTLAAIQEAR